MPPLGVTNAICCQAHSETFLANLHRPDAFNDVYNLDKAEGYDYNFIKN